MKLYFNIKYHLLFEGAYISPKYFFDVNSGKVSFFNNILSFTLKIKV